MLHFVTHSSACLYPREKSCLSGANKFGIGDQNLFFFWGVGFGDGFLVLLELSVGLRNLGKLYAGLRIFGKLSLRLRFFGSL